MSRIKRAKTDADLASASFESAVAEFLTNQPANATLTLIVSESQAYEAGCVVGDWRSRNTHPPVQVAILPDEMVSDTDCWAVATQWGTFWSPGA